MPGLLFHTVVVQVWRDEMGCVRGIGMFGGRSADIVRPWQQDDRNASDELAALLTQIRPRVSFI